MSSNQNGESKSISATRMIDEDPNHPNHMSNSVPESKDEQTNNVIARDASEEFHEQAAARRLISVMLTCESCPTVYKAAQFNFILGLLQMKLRMYEVAIQSFDAAVGTILSAEPIQLPMRPEDAGMIFANYGSVISELAFLEESSTLETQAHGQLSMAKDSIKNTGGSLDVVMDLFNKLALFTLDSGDVPKAKAAFKLLVETQSTNFPRFLSNLGASSLMCGNLEEAALSFQDALIENPDHLEALNNYAITLVVQGREDLAVSLLQLITEKYPTATAVWGNLALALDCTGQYKEAESMYLVATKEDDLTVSKSSWIIQFNLALHFMNKIVMEHSETSTNKNEEIKNLKRCEQLFLCIADVHKGPETSYGLGLLFALKSSLGHGKHFEHTAMYRFKTSIAVDPNYIPSLSRLGLLRLMNSEFDGDDAFLPAQEYFNEALRRLQQMTNHSQFSLFENHLLHNIALAKQSTNPQESIDTYEKILDKDSNNLAALNNLGNLAMSTNQPDRALAYFQHAHNLNPTCALLLNNMALVYIMLGKYDEARVYLHHCLSIDSTLNSATLNLQLLSELQ